MWANEAGVSFPIEQAKIMGRDISYPLLLDANAEPKLEDTDRFLIWFCEHCDIVTKKSVVEKAISWLKACGDLARSKRSKARLDKGIFTSHMPVQIAIKGHKVDYGTSAIASGKEVASRADNLLTHDQMTALMHRSFAADLAIHSDPLRCLQTGLEVRITHQAGCRGQIVRSANFEHTWLHEYDMLANADGINGVTLLNNRGDKTHIIGEGSHFGWMPNINVLFCPSVCLGTCLLYRFTKRREAFPDVCSDNGGANPGHQYKWLPLLITTADTYEADAKNALLPIHGVGKKSQSTCFKQLYAIAGIPSVTGDAIEHVGRAQAQQEAQNAGIEPRDVEEALGYEHSAKKDHYTPQIPLSFQLQRGGLPWMPEKRALVDAAQFRVLREQRPVVTQLLDLAVPELSKQEAAVSAISDLPDDPSSHKEVNDSRRANRDSHKREHRRFLAFVREQMSLAIIGAACRPRNRRNEIRYESDSLIQAHGKERLYRGIRVPVGGTSYGDTWLFDHPLFKQIESAVKDAEVDEKISASAAQQDQVRAQAAAIEERLGPKLEAATKGSEAAIKIANSVPTLMGLIEQCEICCSPPPIGGMPQWMDCCIDIRTESFQGYRGGCYCRDLFRTENSYCRMLADALGRLCNRDMIWHIIGLKSDEFWRKHAKCIDSSGDTYLHLIAPWVCDPTFGDITIAETILDWGCPMDVIAGNKGTAICFAIEHRASQFVKRLINRGADYTSPCNRGADKTPLMIAQKERDSVSHLEHLAHFLPPLDEIIGLLRNGPSPQPAASSDEPPASSKRQKRSKDGGDGIPHADFGSFGKSVSKLWDEYTGTLRQRNSNNQWWFGKGTENKASRTYYHRKCVWYREIARQYELNNCEIGAALHEVQTFADPYFKQGGGGWEKAEAKLREITPSESTESSRLKALYEKL